MARARAQGQAALTEGAAQLVGVTRFVDPAPRPTATTPATEPAIEGGGDACTPLTPLRLAAGVEEAA